jgi:hypothetical protein
MSLPGLESGSCWMFGRASVLALFGRRAASVFALFRSDRTGSPYALVRPPWRVDRAGHSRISQADGRRSGKVS